MKRRRILAIDPTSRGFGFVVVEAPLLRLVDWGTVFVARCQAKLVLIRLLELTRRWQPNFLVMEDHTAPDCRRCFRVNRLLLLIEQEVKSRQIKVRRVSRRAVHRAFADVATDRAPTKREIALVLAERFPALAPHLPPVRRPWMSEDERMSLFDAAALAASAVRSGRMRLL